MSRSKWSARRKSLAIGLAVVGVAGLSLASASQLGLNWTPSVFQAGSVSVTSDCQISGHLITGAFSAPTFAAGKTTPWTVGSAVFSGVDSACNGKTFEVAYTTAAGGTTWSQLAVTPSTVTATDATTPANNKITVPIPSTLDPNSITGWALTIHS